MVLNVTILLFSELSFTVSVSQKAYHIVTFPCSKSLCTLFVHLWKPRKFIVCWLIFPSACTKHLLNTHVLVRKVLCLYLRSTVDFCIQ